MRRPTTDRCATALSPVGSLVEHQHVGRRKDDREQHHREARLEEGHEGYDVSVALRDARHYYVGAGANEGAVSTKARAERQSPDV